MGQGDVLLDLHNILDIYIWLVIFRGEGNSQLASCFWWQEILI
jgi:hypothetical protein